MSKKTPGQILQEKLKAEGDAIRKAMADAETTSKISQVSKDIASGLAEEIAEDSSTLIKKIKAFLPSRDVAFNAIKIVAYWEVAKFALAFML